MSEITCPKCNDVHPIMGPLDYATLKSTGEIISIDGTMLVVATDISDDDVQASHGPLVYCPKEGRHIALGSVEIKVKAEELSDEIIKF